jgi:hypothetical protein
MEPEHYIDSIATDIITREKERNSQLRLAYLTALTENLINHETLPEPKGLHEPKWQTTSS